MKLIVSNCSCGEKCVSGIKYERTNQFHCRYCDPETYRMLAVYRLNLKK